MSNAQVADDLGALMQQAKYTLADILDSDRMLCQEYTDEYLDKIIYSKKYIELFSEAASTESISTEDRIVETDFS